jgi:UDP-N-acetylglucosamine--N-acetylmuramyl-(pentapeptide) pyrophosphoryl-undecaprenol N-acetylglucosamine transferase
VKYILTGGGTGGHVYPALAVAEAVKAQDPEAEFLYVGAKGGAEARLVAKGGYRLTLVHARGLPSRLLSLGLLGFLLSLAAGTATAAWIVLTNRPRAVFGTGGYAAAPVMLACWVVRRLHLTHARLYAHESNARPGRLNLLVGKLADMMFISHAGTERFLSTGRSRLVGYPVRAAVSRGAREAARAVLGLPVDAEVVFVLGGSQGAKSINKATVEALPALLERPRLHVLHAVGPEHPGVYVPMKDVEEALAAIEVSEEARSRYKAIDYVWDMGTAYSGSDVVVCRAGAGTLAETSAAGRPTVVVPKAGLPGDHQVRNAIELEEHGGGVVVYEKHWPGRPAEVDGGELASAVLALLGEPHRMDLMAERTKAAYRPGAAAAMATAMVTGRLPSAAQVDRAVSWLDSVAGLGPLSLPDEVRNQLSRGAEPRDVFRPREFSYLGYKVLELLASSRWEVRNAGVKMAGLLRLSETVELLCDFLTATVRRSWWGKKLFGPYREVGFVRRNSASSLDQIGVWDPHVRGALLAGLGDSYFEVQSSSARAIGSVLPVGEGDTEVERSLRHLLSGHCFDVVREACLALGKVGTEAASVERVAVLFDHPNWKVREAALRALGWMVERHAAHPQDARRWLERLVVTSTDFRVIFPLKQSLRRLERVIAEHSPADEAKP